ncbi:MAG TPA: histidine--tRNA ligase [Ignavibacteriales bacterium]|nr:histidine--tRNA ligase [Ignavibacteriales bacterium]
MIKSVLGTKDIFGEDINKWIYLENFVRTIFNNFCYNEIRTPIFEETQLFKRGIGDNTDIVGKEMYTFLDKGGTSLTLKPEMTAAVVRAFIQHSFAKQSQLNKFFYISPMFRQERPQAGRLRQFHQFGAEVLGAKSPQLDAEMIYIAYYIMSSFNLKNLNVKINTLGKTKDREIFKTELKKFLLPNFARLSEDSKKRFDTNVLRILDSKEPQDIEIINNAPKLYDFIDDESKTYFNNVLELLKLMNVPYEIDNKLVRGLDYYTETTFEIVSTSIGAQSALCGGGRYDGLVSQLGGNETPGVGFAAGMERVLLAIENENSFTFPDNSLDFYIVRLENNLIDKIFYYANILRTKGLKVEFDYLNRSIKAQMREANKLNAKKVIFIGGDEYSNNQFSLKDMKSGEQIVLPLNEIENLKL